MSASNGHLDIVKYLIEEAHLDPNESINYPNPLGASVPKGNLEIIKYLIEEVKLDVHSTISIDLTAL